MVQVQLKLFSALFLEPHLFCMGEKWNLSTFSNILVRLRTNSLFWTLWFVWKIILLESITPCFFYWIFNINLIVVKPRWDDDASWRWDGNVDRWILLCWGVLFVQTSQTFGLVDVWTRGWFSIYWITQWYCEYSIKKYNIIETPWNGHSGAEWTEVAI